MKISADTIGVLKNFMQINPSLYVDGEGGDIRTISPQKTIMAIAKTKDKFTVPFCIYDLGQFLSAVSLFDDPDFSFEEKFVTINKNKSFVRYGYADKNMILQPPTKNIKLPDVIVDFVLTTNTFKQTMQAASVLQVPNWSVIGSDGKVEIVVRNSKDDSSNQYKEEVGETKEEFAIDFRVENLCIMQRDYNVRISSKGISHFATDKEQLQYFIATETK